jgi:hypothetical protein
MTGFAGDPSRDRVSEAGAAAPAVGRAADGWRLERRADGGIDFVAADGTREEDVDLRRAFPLSAPRAGVAVIAAAGGELAWVESLAAVSPGIGTLIEAVLAEREFVPVIERIESITEGRPSTWSVLTDRGPHRFSVGQAEDIVRQPDGALSINDTDGIRYQVARVDALDPRSRRLLERLL